MIINKTEIQPGQNEKLEVNIARLPSHSSIDIVINVAQAHEPGPVLLLIGGLHGDEINGIEIVRRIIEEGRNIPKKGTIICIPIINVYGFIHFSRYVPDGKDVNRSFPGSRNGSLASRVANYLMKDIIPKIDYGLDFHTGGAERTNHPQVRCNMKKSENQKLASIFNAPFTVHSAYRPKSLRYAANKLNKNILIYEGGESSRFDEYAIQQGMNGAIRVMKHLGMTTSEVSHPDYENRIIKSSSWIRAHTSGMFQSMVSSGEKVHKNQVVGNITDPFGDFKIPVKSPTSGFVIGLNNNPILHQGDAVMHIGIV
ncbi:succinylglutamate desuccinylase/aspartoacylase family protein [Saccharicrinis fermentans]|uniref:Aspartoacylase n=1 Tax=Saccharicrinis fermentans DSM 9555 = JCM 21142 TaxID=869213 RepID=W7YLR0_9BACT|nr:succinylglutamate desuccinylase/aspartoacylase family protein [Saccharicrinis fermentans]GAF03304.1 aspartoacylase [Saccharicrinis fermentans DSM 9555 = JCM 21142]